MTGHGKHSFAQRFADFLLAALIAKADSVVIGARVGPTSWESALCPGLPALAVTLAENQRPIAAELSERGLIRWLGHQDEARMSRRYAEGRLASFFNMVSMRNARCVVSLRSMAPVSIEHAGR